ncbi:MAG TPA: pyrroloquinoline quinone-dependent dehydrogenase [Thermoanaerobaculia bacterium]|jgi:quinoprotein glucose dehydrogenase|nr:pyrroloquinoline quinone-dependent dehydrogenase [Thermoanaerobaculia bacterium]
MISRSLTVALALTAILATEEAYAQTGEDWPVWGHDPGGQRFSPLAAIDRGNVRSLKVAWTFHTGDAYQPKGSKPTAFEATPIYVDGTLYLSTPLGRVIALDPVSGQQRWAFAPKIDKDAGYGDYASRGVSTWKSPSGERRIFMATIDAHLIALDAATGKPCADFGENGVVDLRRGLRIPVPADRYADYEETSPPAVVGNTLVIGSGIADNNLVSSPSGEVRGFDVVTGKLKWSWDPIPQDPKAPGAKTWKNGSAQRTGAANAWSVIAADPERNLVFVPTGSPSPDYYGGERLGENRDANSVVALRADTGERVWSFQTVHHDLWDYDVASPPVLFDVHREGRTIPAVGAGSKTGNFFILDRATGKPIFGVEERPVPKSDVAGEVASPTQPFPVAPQSLAPLKMNVDEIQGSEADRKWCRKEIAGLRSEGIFTPPSLRGSLIVPGNIGGMAWGGAAYDPTNHLLLIPVNNLAAEVRLIPRANFERENEANGRDLSGGWEFARQKGTPYGMARRFLRAPGGWPCTPPPWGTLKAIDAETGAVKWTVPLGQLPQMGPAPGPPASYGSVSLGGPIVTAGGLVFMAGTLDSALRAFDVTTGKELWKADLPTSARSVPMTFRGPDGKQYVVISAGGHGLPVAPLGDSVIAFTLGP